MLSLVTVRASAFRLPVRRLRAAGVAFAFAAALVIASSGTTFAWSASSFSAADEKLLFSLTNQDRASAGLPALVNDSYLHKEAQWRAKDMGDRDYFSHEIPPNGTRVFADMSKDGYCFKVAGENIGLSNYGDDVATAKIEKAFMGSKGHRDNILGNWQRLGVGIYKAPDGNKIYFAVLFSIPCGAAAKKATPKPTLKPKPTPKPTAKPTPTPTATPTLSATPSAIVSPSAPVSSPDASGAPDASPSAEPSSSDGTDGTPAPTEEISLRVHTQSNAQGPLDSIFRSLFGGLFGW